MLKSRFIVAGIVVGFGACQALAQGPDPRGLDSLSDERVLGELSRRNLGQLLDHAFESRKTPPGQRDAIRASGGLMRLQNEGAMPLSEKRKIVAEYLKALPQVLPQMTDPRSIISDANLLIEHGVLTDQRLLEYFGNNATIMTRLKPVTDAVLKMLEHARKSAQAASERAESNWPASKAAWEAADRQATVAEYTSNILSYSAAIAVDKADPDRAKRLDDAITYLSAFDTPDNSDRADVRFYISKLNMTAATPESLQAARDGFAFVIQSGNPQNVAQQFESRFFLVSVEINARKPASAQKLLDELAAWCGQNSLAQQAEVQTALAALKYRILSLQSELATSAAEKTKLAQAADIVLDKLQQDQPGLRGILLDLMGARIAAGASVKDLNNLLLQSLRAKAETEVLKPDGTAFDKDVITRGIDAAQELIRRKGDDNRKVVADSQYVLGFFLQKLDRREEAAAAYLEFAENYKFADKERTETSLNNAIALVGDLYREKMGEPAITKLYDRVLTLAVDKPFERMEFAFERGRRLQANGKLLDAAAMYERVPATSKQVGDAKYFELVAIRGVLEKLQSDDPTRPAILQRLQKVADDVNALFTKELGSAEGARKDAIRTRLSQTRVLAADVALRDQKDQARAVELLKGFEETAKGLPGESSLIGEVLLIRVQAFIQSGRVNEATGELVRLAEQRPTETGQLVFNLLQKLDEQVTAAETAGRKDEVAQLENNRAALTPFYVKWIQESANPELKKHAYSAAVFDADTQRRAAELSTDPARRTELLASALDRFKGLDAPEQFQQFLALQPSDKRAKVQYDPQVKLGLARVYFAMGQYNDARMPFALLFRDKVLGDGILTRVNAGGGVDEVDNPNYWEAMLKLMRCNIALGDNVDGMKSWLRDQLSVYGENLGGARWGEEFRKLMKELDIQPTPSTSPTP